MWRAQVLTLLPQMYPGPLGLSLAGKALENGIWGLETLDIRSFARDKHRSVDDTPAGGGPGMVMRPDILGAAVDDALSRWPDVSLIYLSPRGTPFDQALAMDWAAGPGVSLICGRFEGVDERVLDARPITQVSLGDFVLSGGDAAALAILDACVRLLPGVVGTADTLAEESFTSGLLEYPHYTRPTEWDGRTIPEVLTSGDHKKIKAWRQAEAERVTRLRRPDLWERFKASRDGGSPSGMVNKDET